MTFIFRANKLRLSIIFIFFMHKNLSLVIVLLLFIITGCTTPPPPAVVSDTEASVPKKDAEVSIEVVSADEVDSKTSASEAVVDDDTAIADDEKMEVTLDDSPVYEDYSKTKYVALKGKEPFVLFFHANWCPICRRMEKEIAADLENYPKGTRFLKADFDTETELKKEFGIKVQSTVIVFDESGEVIYTAQDPALDDLKAAIEKSVGAL